MSEGPLAGVKVIELTLWMLGPLAGAMLGDLGADVVKIENPRRPDSGRNLISNAGFAMTLEDGRSLMFEAMNRNKRGMALDLSTEAGKAVLLEQAPTAARGARAATRPTGPATTQGSTPSPPAPVQRSP